MELHTHTHTNRPTHTYSPTHTQEYILNNTNKQTNEISHAAMKNRTSNGYTHTHTHTDKHIHTNKVDRTGWTILNEVIIRRVEFDPDASDRERERERGGGGGGGVTEKNLHYKYFDAEC